MIKKMRIILLVIVLCISGTVYSDEIDTDKLIWEDDVLQTSNTSEEPKLNSRAAVIYDRKSKKIIWGKKENEKRPMASTTKIMTAIIVLENANLSDTVTVSKKSAGTGGSRLGLKVGDKITVNNLLYGLLMVSGNDAAVALAEYVGGSVEGFADKMNQKAEELGLESTHFITPHGLDMADHYTTALELAEMADYAMNNEKFAQIVNTKNITININGRSKSLKNTNELLGNLNGVNGVKTGFTNGANRCLVTSVNKDEMNIITVVLGADTKKDRTNDSIKLIEYAYKNYTIYNLEDIINEEYQEWKNINEKRIKIVQGKNKYISTGLDKLENYYIPIKKQDINNIRVEIYALKEMEAPIYENDYIGKLIVYNGEEKIVELCIRSNVCIERLTFWDYFYCLLKDNISNMENAIS